MRYEGADRSSKLTPADKAELTDLVDRYAALVDDRDFTALAGLFTDDGVLRQPRPPKHMEPSDTVVGRAAIEENFARLKALRATQHAIVSRVFSAEGGGGSAEPPCRAEGRTGAIAHHVSGKDDALTDHAWHLTYRDRYRRVDGVWLIAERTLDLHWIEQRRVSTVRPRRGPDHS